MPYHSAESSGGVTSYMRFLILGCLEAEAGGRRLPLGGLSEQKVLVVLLLDANRTVAVSRLVDALWDDPPVTAAKQARNAVSRLRKVLAEGGIADVVLTDGAGYRLPVTDDALDARQFEALVARAQADTAGAGTARRPKPWDGRWRCGAAPRSPGWPARPSKPLRRRGTSAGARLSKCTAIFCSRLVGIARPWWT